VMLAAAAFNFRKWMRIFFAFGNIIRNFQFYVSKWNIRLLHRYISRPVY
jgi:hypothetical protein